MNPDELIGKTGTVQAVVSKGFQPILTVKVLAYRYRFGALDYRVAQLDTKAPVVVGWVPEWKVKFDN
jgi:hypothetical protein